MDALLLTFACAVCGQYVGPLPGQIKNATITVDYVSDALGVTVKNEVENLSPDPVPISWLGGHIDRTVSPLKPKETHSTTFWCPRVAVNGSAEIVFGLAAGKQPAPAYDKANTPAGAREKAREAFPPQVLNSEVSFGLKEEPYRLQVISTYIDGDVIYSFIRNRAFQVSFKASPSAREAFSKYRWTIGEMRLDTVAHLKEWDAKGFTEFVNLTAPLNRTAIRFSAPRVAASPQLVLISGEGGLLGTGIISLHAETP